jgi:hypothetical protein
MAERRPRSEREWHRRMAAKEFNLVWSLLEKKRRTADEDDRMIHAAHSSRYHWGIVGKPVHLAIGEWQISHVYAVLKRAEPSRYHAERCLAICRRHHVGDFPLAFAYEALVRAAAISGDAAARDRYLVRAREAGRRIRDDEDRAQFFADLGTIPRRRRK